MLIGASQLALATHPASHDVGRWNGFAHQAGQLVAGSPVTLDLNLAATSTRVLQGTISGLPAVQMPLNVSGAVTNGGELVLVLTATGFTGTLEGKVANLAGFTHDGDPDNIGDFTFNIKGPTGKIQGHLDMIHLYGGANWGTVVAPNLLGSAQGAALVGESSTAVDGATTVSGEVGSGLVGSVSIGGNQYAAVGTISDQGSLIFLGDGSVRPDPTKPPSLVGLLFAGAVAMNLAGPAEAVGHFHQGFFGTLLPAVQTIRPGAMSLNWQTTTGS
jgi:hypothetical protein